MAVTDRAAAQTKPDMDADLSTTLCYSQAREFDFHCSRGPVSGTNQALEGRWKWRKGGVV